LEFVKEGGEKKQMNKVKKLFGPLAAGALSLAMPAAALAQGTNVVPLAIRPVNNALDVVRGIVQFILIVAFIAAFVFLLIGGIRWIIAGGDEKAVAGARGTITAALIGLVIVLVAYAIIRLVEIFFNVNIVTTGVTIPNITSIP